MNNIYTILENKKIANDTYQMKLKGDTTKISTPGQFLNIKIDDSINHFLRRPISICSYKESEITIIYKILGQGTKALSKKKRNTELDILCPLGNGFTMNQKANHQLLIGGGIGVPPLYQLAKELKALGVNFKVVLGYNTIADVFYEKEFQELSNDVFIATMDGSYGYKGNVIELIHHKKLAYDYYYACGPEQMLEALIRTKKQGQLSFEARMGCGFGACMGCSKKTVQSYKRICKDGPVLEAWEVYLDE